MPYEGSNCSEIIQERTKSSSRKQLIFKGDNSIKDKEMLIGLVSFAVGLDEKVP